MRAAVPVSVASLLRQIRAQERHHHFVMGIAVVLFGAPLDYATIGRFDARLLALRLSWVVLGLLGLWGYRRLRAGRARAITIALAVLSVGAVAIIAWLTGEVGTIAFASFGLLPLAFALVVPESPASVAVAGVSAFVTTALLLSAWGTGTWLTVAWLGHHAAVAAFASYGALRYRRQRLSEMAAVRERVRAQQQLAREKANREQAQKLHHVQQFATIGGLSASVLHELNNPLTVIVMVSTMLDRARTNEAMHRQLVAQLTSATEAMKAMSEGMRRAVKRTPGLDEHASVARAVDDVAQLCRHQVEDVATLEVDVSEPLDGVALPHVRLVQILVNLVVNATDACAECPDREHVIRIEARHAGCDVVLTVSDTGPGMSEEAAERAFEPFFTTKGEAGAGLGLALCSAYAGDAGGSLSMTAGADEPTVFTLRLPTRVPLQVAGAA